VENLKCISVLMIILGSINVLGRLKMVRNCTSRNIDPLGHDIEKLLLGVHSTNADPTVLAFWRRIIESRTH